MQSKNNTDNQFPSDERSFIERARRAQIIAATIDVIAEEGFARASLARIGKQAKISAGVISYHFAGKADLIQEVVREIYTLGADFMRPQIEGQPSPSAMLRAYIESNLAFIRTYPKHLGVLLEIAVHFRNDDGTMPFDAAEVDQVLLVPEWIFKSGQEQGEFRPFSPRIMAITLRAAIDAVPPRFAANPDLVLEQYAQELVTLFNKATQQEEQS
jgi:TetR/AcrR family fatty acid metabolism transcriptional regulator